MMLIRFVFSAHRLGFLMLLKLFASSYICSVVHNMSTICSYISSVVQCVCMTMENANRIIVYWEYISPMINVSCVHI